MYRQIFLPVEIIKNLVNLESFVHLKFATRFKHHLHGQRDFLKISFTWQDCSFLSSGVEERQLFCMHLHWEQIWIKLCLYTEKEESFNSRWVCLLVVNSMASIKPINVNCCMFFYIMLGVHDEKSSTTLTLLYIIKTVL